MFKRQQILWKSPETPGLRHSLHRSQKNIAGRRRWSMSLRFACYKIITQLRGIELLSFPVFWGSSQQKGSSKTTNRSPSSLISDTVAMIPPVLAGSVSAFLGISLKIISFPCCSQRKISIKSLIKKHCVFLVKICVFYFKLLVIDKTTNFRSFSEHPPGKKKTPPISQPKAPIQGRLLCWGARSPWLGNDDLVEVTIPKWS